MGHAGQLEDGEQVEPEDLHADQTWRTVRSKEAERVTAKLREMKLADAAALAVAGVEETLYFAFPHEHWRCLPTNNALERLLREVRRRTRVGGSVSRWQVGIDAGSGKTAPWRAQSGAHDASST